MAPSFLGSYPTPTMSVPVNSAHLSMSCLALVSLSLVSGFRREQGLHYLHAQLMVKLSKAVPKPSV